MVRWFGCKCSKTPSAFQALLAFAAFGADGSFAALGVLVTSRDSSSLVVFAAVLRLCLGA